MAAGKSVSDILAGAKAALNHANDVDNSLKKELPPPAPTPVAKPDYSNAPYSLVKKKPDLKSEAASAAAGIKARIEMERKARQ